MFRKEDIVGKTVIETSGATKGKVTDVTFDLQGTVTLVVLSPDGAESQVKLSRVTGISDHIVVRSEGPLTASGPSMQTACKFCGAPKASDAIWCPACGKSQA